MGARQVLRVAVVVAALAGIASAEPVILIDLRSGDDAASRAELAKSLEGIQGVTVKRDAGLDGALAGEASDLDAAEAMAAIDEARAAYAAPDCAKARPAAAHAIDLLAARQASGLDDGNALRGMWAIELLCADQAGDRRAAQTAADRLHALGVVDGADAGVSEPTWQRFPEIDAHAEGPGFTLTVTTDPPGADVWIDHVKIGASPASLLVYDGEHEIAAGAGEKRASTRVTIDGAAASAVLTLADRTGPYSAVAGVVKGWRDGNLTPTAEALATVMQALDVRFALILAGQKSVQVWAMGPGDAKPHLIDNASRDDVMGIGAMITDRIAAWDDHAPDPDHALMVETPEERAAREHGTPQRWWVYAAILGAVVAGSTVLYLQDSATDTQTITLHFP